MTQTTRLFDRPVYLVDGTRTPFLKMRGVPGPFTASDLALQCGRPLLLRQPFQASDLNQVIQVNAFDDYGKVVEKVELIKTVPLRREA